MSVPTPPTPANAARGEIYDLGYRNYGGPRLGRWYAVRSLATLSLKHTFGFGRGVGSKVVAFLLIAFALVPAVIQLAFVALIRTETVELFKPRDYFGSIQSILILFVAAMASELVGNDRKNNVLPLYFSRPIRRTDYLLAKTGALVTGLQVLTFLPLLVLFVGTWLNANDSSDWLADNWRDLPAGLGSSVLVSATFASLGILIATFCSKRALALVSILGFLFVTFLAAQILAGLLPRLPAAAVLMLSPAHVTQAATAVLFGEMPDGTRIDRASGGPVEQAASVGLPGLAWVAVCLAHIALATWLAVRRYRKVM